MWIALKLLLRSFPPGRFTLRYEQLPHTNEVMETMLTEKQITEIQDVLIEELGVKRDQIKPEARIMEDLPTDSLALVEITMRLEDQFEIVIADEEVEKVSTVGDLLALMSAKLN